MNPAAGAALSATRLIGGFVLGPFDVKQEHKA
jgi:hypothetical protein